MVKRIKYFAKGLILCELNEGGTTMVLMDNIQADTYVGLMSKATLMLLSGKLVGISELIGAVLDIKVQTIVEIDDENFVSEKLIFDSVGDLSIEQYEELQAELLFSNNKTLDVYER